MSTAIINPEDLLVLRLRAGTTEVAIVPTDTQSIMLEDVMGREQRAQTMKRAAIRIIAEALDAPHIRAAFVQNGMRVVVVP